MVTAITALPRDIIATYRRDGASARRLLASFRTNDERALDAACATLERLRGSGGDNFVALCLHVATEDFDEVCWPKVASGKSLPRVEWLPNLGRQLVHANAIESEMG